MNKLTYMLLVINSLFLAACGNKAQTIAQIADYPIKRSTFYVRYIEVKRELQAEVRFYSDSSNFRVPKGVMLNDIKLVVRELPEVGVEYRYIKENVAYKPPYTFSYQNPRDSTLRFELNMPRLDSLQVGSKGISLKAGGLVVWKGQALGAEDALRIIVTDSKGQNLTFNHIGISRGAQIELMAAELNPLSVGKATLTISQQKHIAASTNNLACEYYYMDIETEIVP